MKSKQEELTGDISAKIKSGGRRMTLFGILYSYPLTIQQAAAGCHLAARPDALEAGDGGHRVAAAAAV